MSQALIITGMHRSGTSMVANVMQRAGVHIGSDLLGPREGNPRGHFEDLEFLDFHQCVLDRAGTPVFCQDAAEIELPSSRDSERARELIEQRNDHALWGFKDPRTSLLLGFWNQLLPDARYLFVFRHPIDVALSLRRRGLETEILIDAAIGVGAWVTYNESILSFLENHDERCLLVNIDAAVRDIDSLLDLAAHKLGLKLSRDGVAGLVRREELSHAPHGPEIESLLTCISPRAARLYAELCSRADLQEEPEAAEADSEVKRRLHALGQFGDSLGTAERRDLLALTLSVLDPTTAAKCNATLKTRWNEQLQQIEDLEDHANNLEALRQRDRGQLDELRAHTRNLEEREEVDASQVEDFRAHAENLEKLLEGRAEAQSQLESSLEHEKKSVKELRAHARNLEKLLQEKEEAQEQLEASLQHEKALAEAVRAHATNLEQLVQERDEMQDQLLVSLAHERAQLRDFVAHAGNLEQLVDEGKEELNRWREHARDLSERLGRDRAETEPRPDEVPEATEEAKAPL